MIAAIAPAAEGPPPMYNGAPDDAQPIDLQGALAQVDSVIWRDGGMDAREQAIFMAWVQKTIMRARASAAMAQQSEGQAAGLGSSSVSDYDSFGQTGDNGTYE